MHGYVFSIEESCKYPFRFENGNITVYNRDAISVENVDSYNINLQSDLDYLIAEDMDTYGIKVFFVNNVPFASDNWNWSSYESKRVYYYLELKNLLQPLSFNKIIFKFSELNFFYPVKNGFLSGHNEESIFTVEPIPYQQTNKVSVSICMENRLNWNSEYQALIVLLVLLHCLFLHNYHALFEIQIVLVK